MQETSENPQKPSGCYGQPECFGYWVDAETTLATQSTLETQDPATQRGHALNYLHKTY